MCVCVCVCVWRGVGVGGAVVVTWNWRGFILTMKFSINLNSPSSSPPWYLHLPLLFLFFSDTLRKKNGKFSDIPLLLSPSEETGSAFHLVCRFIYFASVGMPFSCTSCLRAPPQCFAWDLSHVTSVHFCLPTSSALPFLLFAMHAMPSR